MTSSSNILGRAADGRRIILGHDWLTGMRGGERVLEHFCESFPEAPVATLLYNPSVMSETIRRHDVLTSWLNRVPGIAKHYRLWLPFFPLAAGSLKLPDADVLLTSSHCVAKSFRKPTGAKHLCYCFTPMRYAWTFPDEYFGKTGLRRTMLTPLLAWLRAWDSKTAAGVDRFVAISRHVAERIQSFYGRECDVVYPPVDVDRCTPAANAAGGRGGYDLIVSALVPYKRLDLAVETYSRRGWPLKIVGAGGCFRTLAQKAAPCVEMLGWRSDEEVLELYRNCRLLIFPGEEDFGIVPLEAQACGRPVVAYARGGALETVVPQETGIFFPEQTEEALADAVQIAAERRWDSHIIRKHAETFGPDRFLSGIADSLSALVSDERTP